MTGTGQWETLRAAAPLPGGRSRAGAVPLVSPPGEVLAVPAVAVPAGRGARCARGRCPRPAAPRALRDALQPRQRVPVLVTRAAGPTLPSRSGKRERAGERPCSGRLGACACPLPACSGMWSFAPGRFVQNKKHLVEEDVFFPGEFH